MRFFDFSDDVETEIARAPDEQSRLAAKTTVHRSMFPTAVRMAGFGLLAAGCNFTPGVHDVVIGIATWSDRDLAALDSLVSYTKPSNLRVSVFDIDGLSPDEMARLLPGFKLFSRTPVVFQYRHAHLSYFGEGDDALHWLAQL